ncbi:MAG TPA: alpha/beta fold hydrolase [Bacillota bacterium]
MAGFREGMIAVGGIRVHTLIGGRGEPVLVLHGAEGNPGWRRWLNTLSEHFTLYVPTHPGYGRSDDAEWMASITDLARFYLWYLDVLGLSRVHAVGWSMGGWTAAEMAVMCPHAFNRLVLVAPAGLKPEEGYITDIFFHTLDELRAMRFYDPAQVPEYEELYGREPTPEEQAIAMRNREMAARLTWKPYMHNPQLPYFLPRVDAPTLIVWGREDRIVPVICGHQYQRLLPKAQLRIFERCGHLPQLEKVDEFSELVLDFLTGRRDG